MPVVPDMQRATGFTMCRVSRRVFNDVFGMPRKTASRYMP